MNSNEYDLHRIITRDVESIERKEERKVNLEEASTCKEKRKREKGAIRELKEEPRKSS